MKFNFKKNLLTIIFIITSTIFLVTTVIFSTFLMAEIKKADQYSSIKEVTVNFYDKEEKVIESNTFNTKWATLEELLASPYYGDNIEMYPNPVFGAWLQDAYSIINSEADWYLMLYSDSNKGCEGNADGACDFGVSFLYLEDNDTFDIRAKYIPWEGFAY